MDKTIPLALNDRDVRNSMHPDIMDLHVECFRDFGLLCKTWFPDYFRLPYTSLHYKIIDFIQDVLSDQAKAIQRGTFAGRKMCIIGNRGLAKSGFTLQGLGFRQLMYGRSSFMIFATKSATNSVTMTDTLKNHLLTDPTIRKFFGSIKANTVTHLDDGTKADDIFGKTMWRGSTDYAPDGFTVLPRGVGQQIRGLNVNGQRPDLILCDDIDDMDWLRNDEVRKKYHDEWFPGSVEFCVSQFEAENIPWLISVSDTCKGSNCLVEQLSEDPDYDTLRVALCDSDFKTLAPDFKSQEQLDKDVARARAKGNIDVFAREAMSIPIASESAPFKPEWFQDRYFTSEDEEKMDFNQHDCISFVMMDPARTLSANADNTAIVGATVNFKTCRVYYRRVVKAKLEQWEMIDQALDMCQELRADFLGTEYAGLHRHIESAIEEAVSRRRMYNLELVELKPHTGRGEFSGEMGGKVGRIKWGLQGWFRAGCIFLHESCKDIQSELELLLSPGAKKDVADAAAYLRQIMESLDLVFEPAYEVVVKDSSRRRPSERLTMQDRANLQQDEGVFSQVRELLDRDRENHMIQEIAYDVI